MTDRTSPQWTAEALLTPEGVHAFSSQVEMVFQRRRRAFRELRLEVFAELLATPIPGDNAVQGRMHAWRVARQLHVMERNAQSTITAARRLEAVYRRLYVELPQARRAKELQIARRAELTARTSADIRDAANSALAEPAEVVDVAAEPPAFDLFRNAK
ncbi:hypothetical protein [Streptodolium elevatio]